jgi:predicted aspartyl protease
VFDLKVDRKVRWVVRKLLCLLFAGTLLVAVAAAQSGPTTPQALYQLVQQKDYLGLQSALAANRNLATVDSAVLKAVLANRKNQVADSIQLIEPLVPTLAVDYSQRTAIALCTLADDYARSFRYGSAADTYRLLSRLPGYQPNTANCRAELEASRWELLRNAAPQTSSVSAPFNLQATRTPLGLEVPVSVANVSDEWLVDTGANISAITRSVAERLGLELSTAASTAQGSSGLSVPVHTAVIPELQLGLATVRNVAVLVFEDKDLDFSQLPFEMHGSIGLPVLQSLGAITIHSNGMIGVQEPLNSAPAVASNLYMERLTLLLEVSLAGQPELLTLDTGASGTFLSSHYYQQHLAKFAAVEQTIVEVAGAGGSLNIPAIMLSDVKMNVGGACASFTRLPMFTQSTGLDDELSGNMGQSTIRHFASYTLDFRTMTFTAESSSADSGSSASCVVSD